MVALAVLAAIAALVFIYQRALSAGTVEPQKRQTQGRRSRPRTPAPERPERSKSLFKHEDHQSGLKCSSCHAIPSATEPDRIAAATRPSSVLGYPYHDSCLRCHRQQAPQFFRGASPAICTVCHTRVSPRLTARDVHPQFPSLKRDDKMEREYPAFFTHRQHQEPARMKDTKLLDCATCHKLDARGPLALPLKGIQSEERFKTIAANTFETIPGEREAKAHASCVECHWQKSQPTFDNCNGCHLTRTAYTARKLEIIQPPDLSPNAARWFKDWPAEVPMRRALKFRHDTHKDSGCTDCHKNMGPLPTDVPPPQSPRPDVHISACIECHGTLVGIPLDLVDQNIKITLCQEIDLKSDVSKNYPCVACHTALIGREKVPPSHFSTTEPCPKTAQPEEE